MACNPDPEPWLRSAVGQTSRRVTREIGLRVALGADRTQIARLVLTEAMAVAVLRMCVGLALTVAGDRPTATWLAGIAPLNLEALYTAPAILIAMVAAAAVIPLRKALRVSAPIALKAE
ncbi:MAG: FtsX-like permease family protein [Vicinamibacterales bacterium]